MGKLIAHAGLAFQHILSPTAESGTTSVHGTEALGGGQGKAQREGHLLRGSTGPRV